jgi:mannose-6-phosphate isomerase-like protein (cupin superfamily)
MKGMMMDAVILTPGEGREMMLGSVRVTVQEDGAHTRGTFGLAEFAFPPHAPAPPPHVHHAHEEGFYILEGELEFLVGGERIQVGQGTFILVPIGVAHSFGNPTDRPARFLNTFTPPRYLGYFEEMSRQIAASGPLNPSQARELMAHYETDVVA